jgi:tryptophan aminotransferase
MSVAHATGGVEGFLNHAQHVADFYASRRQRFEDLAHKHLDGLAKWVSPTAGMFLWLDLSPAGVKDSYALVRTEALAKGVLAVPGYS